mgnify:CR=1 FL=1
MKDIMNFDDFITKFIQWTEDTIEKPRSDLDAQPICPFARKARLTKKIQFIDNLTKTKELRGELMLKISAPLCTRAPRERSGVDRHQ